MTRGLHLDPKELLSLPLPVQTFIQFWSHFCFPISKGAVFCNCTRKKPKHFLCLDTIDDDSVLSVLGERTLWPFFETHESLSLSRSGPVLY